MTNTADNRLEIREDDREMVHLLTTLNQTKRAIVKGFILGLKETAQPQAGQDSAGDWRRGKKGGDCSESQCSDGGS